MIGRPSAASIKPDTICQPSVFFTQCVTGKKLALLAFKIISIMRIACKYDRPVKVSIFFAHIFYNHLCLR